MDELKDYEDNEDQLLTDYPDECAEMGQSEYLLSEEDDEELEELDEFFSESGDDSATMDFVATLICSEDAQKLREPGQASKLRFQHYADIVNDKNLPEEERQRVMDDACKRLEGFIVQVINEKFHNYVEQDPTFRNDLILAAQTGIIANMGKYDMTKGQPLTFFSRTIIHEMVCETNSMKNNTKSHIASIKKKIMEVNAMFAKEGLGKPSLEDYVYILNSINGKDDNPRYTRSRIKNALITIQNQRPIVSMDNLPPTAPQPISDLNGRRPESTEMTAIQNINGEMIQNRMKAITPNEQHRQIFLAYAEYNCSTASAARALSLSEEYVKSVVQEMKKKLSNDEVIVKTYPEHTKINRRDAAGLTTKPVAAAENNMQMLSAAIDGTGIIVQGRKLKLAIS